MAARSVQCSGQRVDDETRQGRGKVGCGSGAQLEDSEKTRRRCGVRALPIRPNSHEQSARLRARSPLTGSFPLSDTVASAKSTSDAEACLSLTERDGEMDDEGCDDQLRLTLLCDEASEQEEESLSAGTVQPVASALGRGEERAEDASACALVARSAGSDGQRQQQLQESADATPAADRAGSVQPPHSASPLGGDACKQSLRACSPELWPGEPQAPHSGVITTMQLPSSPGRPTGDAAPIAEAVDACSLRKALNTHEEAAGSPQLCCAAADATPPPVDDSTASQQSAAEAEAQRDTADDQPAEAVYSAAAPPHSRVLPLPEQQQQQTQALRFTIRLNAAAVLHSLQALPADGTGTAPAEPQLAPAQPPVQKRDASPWGVRRQRTQRAGRRAFRSATVRIHAQRSLGPTQRVLSSRDPEVFYRLVRPRRAGCYTAPCLSSRCRRPLCGRSGMSCRI